MNYVVLSLIARNSFSLPEFEEMKRKINKALMLEYVDDTSIVWDEKGEVLFHPPIYKSDKGYWVSLLSKIIDNTKWEISTSKL